MKSTLNSETSHWENSPTDAPQGSILGTLFFLTYIDEITNNFQSHAKLLADVTLVSEIYDSLETANKLKK